MAARLGLSGPVVGALGSVPDRGGWLPSHLLTPGDGVPGCLSPRQWRGCPAFLAGFSGRQSIRSRREERDDHDVAK